MKALIYVPFAPRGGSLKNLRQLLSIWSGEDGHDFVIAAPANTHRALDEVAPRSAWARVQIPDRDAAGWRRIWFERWNAARLLNRVRADVIFAPGGTVPRGINAPVVANFQNLLPVQPDLWRLTQDVPLYVRQRGLRLALRAALNSSHAQIFNSENARQEFVQFSGRALPRAAVIPRAMEIPEPDVGGAEALRAKLGIGADYLISVGQIFAYRNYIPVFEGFRRALDAQGTLPPLLLAGAASSMPEFRRILTARDRLGLSDHVLLPGELPYRVVLGLLSQARLNFFTSSVENCPNALLEAMALGTPSICARMSSNPEFGQDAVFYVNPRNPGDWQRAITQMLDDAALRERLIIRGQAITQQSPTPEVIARQTWRVLQNAANAPHESSRS